MTRKRVAILGSTGSIGTQALDVIAAHEEHFVVAALAAGRNAELLAAQAARFRPDILALAHGGEFESHGARFVRGVGALHAAAVESAADIVLAATDGAVAFDAVFAAVERGIDVAVANKELVVSAGPLLMESAARHGARIVPVDSEHSAIFQCLVGERVTDVATIVLTASGGPFWRKSAEEMRGVSVDDALAHPTWRMGPKNTIDSATMMNKGLEMIEACRLFGVRPAQVAILVHPQSVAHGAVIFKDGSVKAQLAPPDMRLPIGYALAYPARLDSGRAFDAFGLFGGHPEAVSVRHDYERPDAERFPCVRLAYAAAEAGGTAPAALSAANEIAVAAFLNREIRFGQIAGTIESALAAVPVVELTLEAVRAADAAARAAARSAVDRLKGRVEV
ncbi:MAG: 1-deoxy-D-xylulose-5-phosphate reductoisomerase [Candidatus Eremiobacteraeota bacterium]|nr:1-deoxy-D-xylulose-5-phosphate reductoisomerase [Candidatus Eremiobacteraeota bacterium]